MQPEIEKLFARTKQLEAIGLEPSHAIQIADLGITVKKEALKNSVGSSNASCSLLAIVTIKDKRIDAVCAPRQRRLGGYRG
jgi:hypothetical protein